MARHRSAAERQREVARWRASGLSVSMYCATHGMSAESLRRWRSEAEGEGPVAAEFVRVEVARRPEQRGLLVAIGRARVRVERGFDGALLRELVEALAAEAPC